MTNALAIPSKKPAFLAKVEASTAVADRFSAGLGGDGIPLPFLSFRGKVFRLRKDGQEASTKSNTIEVILVDSRPNNSKRFFEGQYVQGETEAPRCSSVDGVTPDVDDPVCGTCAACPNNVWGSANRTGSAAKACADYKRLVVIPLVGDKAYGPCILDVPAASLRTPKGADPKEMQLREYIKLLSGNGADPCTVVTEISFTDDEFPRLVFTYKRYVTEAEYKSVQAAQEEEDVKFVIAGDGVEFEGKGKIVGADTPEELAPAPKKKPAAKKPEPKPEPEEAEAPEEDEVIEAEVVEDAANDDDEALLDEIEALLGG